MHRRWSNGFGLGADWLWAAPVASSVLVGIGQATNADGDLRSGGFPWFMAVASVCLAFLCLRVIGVHERRPSRPVVIGGWWTALAFLGIAGFFVAIGVGALVGIDEESMGAVAWLPVLSMAFGLLSMAPAVALVAFGAGRAAVLPRWAVWALWLVAPLLVVLLVYGGLVEGAAETVGSSVILATYAAGWVLVGLGVRPAYLARQAEAPARDPGRTRVARRPRDGPEGSRREGIERVELTEPWDAVIDAGHQPVLLSTAAGEVQTYDHLDRSERRPVDRLVRDAAPEDYDALVLPGGVANPDALRLDEDAVSFVRGFVESGRTVAAICHAPWTLIEAGVVAGRRLTSWPSLRTDLINAGATWVDERLVTDGNLITSRKPDDLPAFMSALLEAVHHGADSVGATFS